MSILFLLGCCSYIWNMHTHTHRHTHTQCPVHRDIPSRQVSLWNFTLGGSHSERPVHTYVTHTHVCYGCTVSPWSELSFPFSWPKQFGFHLRVSVLPAANKCNRTVKHSERQKKERKKKKRLIVFLWVGGWMVGKGLQGVRGGGCVVI